MLRKVALVLGMAALVLYLAGFGLSQQADAKAVASSKCYVITVMVEDTEFEDGASMVTQAGEFNLAVSKDVTYWQKRLIGGEAKEAPSYAQIGISFNGTLQALEDGVVALSNYKLEYRGLEEEKEEGEEDEEDNEEHEVEELLSTIKIQGSIVVKEGVETIIGKVGDREIKVKVSALK